MESQYQIRSQDVLAEEETFLLQQFFKVVDQYQVLLNKQLQIIAFNETAFNFHLQVLQLKLKTGSSLTDFIEPSFNGYFKTLCHKAFQGAPVHFEHFINGHEEKKLWLDFTIYPLRDRHGKASGLMMVGNNINHEKKREKLIRHQSETLSVIAQLQSHQVRHPVSSILGIINLIKEENFEMKQEYILGLESATRQLDEVIRAIVNQSRKE